LEMSLPSVNFQIGKIHPLQKVYDDIIEIFSYLGFDIQQGPEIEFEDYNFTLLNIPEDHPARDMQDTLYLDLPATEKGKVLLRTHTSPVQIRLMLSKKPPIKSIMPGRVFRNENLDATHSFNFHQVEGLVVDKNIKLSDLKGILTYFVRLMFDEDIVCKFRQSYFPFTEPSLELDIQCLVCKGSGCSVCKYSGFVEILGCGMVHPQVLYNVGLGYEEYTGFAFGLGVERVTMLKYRIDNMRLFYENDLRFIKQF
ncbi:MAG: phenylalanine--tRNA ligase subunit alpha, partial [Endomicrobiia bacterium]